MPLAKKQGQPPFWYCNSAFAQHLGFSTPKFPRNNLPSIALAKEINQKRWYPERKIGKSEKIFTPFSITT